jgi:VanZ family protein
MRTYIYAAIVLLWMALIISLSHQAAPSSNELSTGVTYRIVNAVEWLVPGVDLEPKELNHAVRKYAHFFIFLVLGMLIAGILKKLGVKGFRGAVIALLICVLFAVSDELHQLFVIGRGAQARDVLIDSAGSAVGIAIFKGLGRLSSK